MSDTYNVLILGASYGSLLAAKLLLAGYRVKLVCLPDEAKLINEEGIRVRLPVRGRSDPVELDSRRLPGTLSADTPKSIDPAAFDVVTLAMQEPQYRARNVRQLLLATARSRVPCMSIMNMPPPPYLARIGVGGQSWKQCYVDPSVWDDFDPALMTLASPDPQAVRPSEAKANVLQVGLATNFKVARFESKEHTAMLRRMQSDVESASLETEGEHIELPVKIKVHESVFVPLAKWSMLLAGNYRCVQADRMRSIKDAVHTNIELSRSVYDWVGKVCRALGASEQDLVPFEKYAEAAKGLVNPSSAARALAGGATHIERVDCLVRNTATQHGMHSEAVDEVVSMVDAWLGRNKKAA